MGNDTVTLKIRRSGYIEANSDVALIRLDTMNHIKGQPVMISYYNDNGDVETLTAVGIQNGAGKDCYSITSASREEVVNGVIRDLPDVSALVNGAIYISYYNEHWSRVYIQYDEVKRVDVLDPAKSFIVKDLSTGLRWFWSGGVLKCETDYFTMEQITDEVEKLRQPRVISCSFRGNPVQLDGTVIESPTLLVSITEGNKNVSDDYIITVVSDTYGNEAIEDQTSTSVTLYRQLDSTTTYTVTATLIGTETFANPTTLEASCRVLFTPYTLYKKSKSSDRDEILASSSASFSTILWDGTSDLTLNFANLDLDYTIIMIPYIFDSVPNYFLDDNGLNYRKDYDTYDRVTYDSTPYILLVKKDAVTIDNFKQVLKYGQD